MLMNSKKSLWEKIRNERHHQEWCDDMDTQYEPVAQEYVYPPMRYWLLALCYVLIYCPYMDWKIKRCDHKNMIDHSYGGPEGGCMAGECPDCGFSFSETLY